jgi:1,4-dihydroxy-2-naphthoyl-CoA synthase
MSDSPKKISTDKATPGHWRVTLNNPPINAIDDSMYDELFDLVEEIEAEPSLKVVTFESANPDFFIAHYSTAEPRSRFGTPRWIDTATRLAQSDVLSIAVIRGRVRGGGSEFALACDVRFASRERAIFSDCRFWWGDRGRSRSSSARTISMLTPPNDMGGSTAPFRRASSMLSSPISCGGSYRSTDRH